MPANVLLIAATNRADSLDPALLRPGRFDRRLTFELPAKNGRRELIDHFLAGKSHDAELDLDERRDALAAITQGYSPVRIEHLLDEALVSAVRRGARTMSWKDVEQARLVEEVGTGAPVDYTPHERRLIATHEAGHATLAWLTAPQRRLEVLTIIRRRGSLGLLAHGDREEVYTRSRTELRALVQIAFGGQCAEELFFGDVSTGPGGDLLYATNCAAEMVGAHGMDASLISYLAVQNGALSDTNIVGRVLADDRGRDQVEALLQEQKADRPGAARRPPAPRRGAARRPARARGAGRARDHRRARGRRGARPGPRPARRPLTSTAAGSAERAPTTAGARTACQAGRVSPDRPARGASYVLVLVLTLLLALWGAFTVLLRVGTVPLPVGVLLAAATLPLCRAGGRLLERRVGAVLPGLLWVAVGLLLAGQRREGDLVLASGLRGTAFLVVGVLGAAYAVGSWRPPAPAPAPGTRELQREHLGG